MRNDDKELRYFERPDAGLEQARAIIAAKIINILDDRKLSIRDAEKLTGVSHSEFSRIRNTQLRRFTLDRMIVILGKLDENVEVKVTTAISRPRRACQSRTYPKPFHLPPSTYLRPRVMNPKLYWLLWDR
jgi:predicted XRE-type DNA-binding protein